MPLNITSLRNIRTRYTIIMSLLAVYLFATYVAVEYYVFNKSKVNHTRGPNLSLEYVVVHIDMKGAPPKLEYLTSILPMLKNHGVNALLIEYEDMFPYEGRLRRLKAPDCFKKNELQAYLATAASSGFEIIPLVQTFGHMEFALKIPKFAHLRENLNFTDSICPSASESQKFLREMLNQQIHFHQSIAPLKHIHVGCDEVYHLNNCSICRKRNLTKEMALTSHINFVIRTVRTLSPNSKVLIWDDMYRTVKPLHCLNFTFPKTEAVYWDYTTKDHEDVHTNMFKYSRMFDNLWIATAFKGADGPSSILPDLNKRFYNHLHWLNFILDYSTAKKLYKIKGIILTGWSRYKHSHPLCELLPASIPSLILNLILIQKYKNGIVVKDMKHVDAFINQHLRNNVQSSLKCQNDLDGLPDLFDARNCKYDESDLYVVLQNLSNRTLIINNIIEENAYKHKFLLNTKDTAPQVEYEYIDDSQVEVEVCTVIFHELLIIRDDLIGLLSVYFENYVIKEYIASKVHRMATIIKAMFEFWNYRESQKVKISARNTTRIQNMNKTA